MEIVALRHLITNARFSVDDDLVEGETCVTVQRVDKRHSLHLSLSRYLDRFERRDGEWRIAHRRVVPEWRSTGVLAGAAGLVDAAEVP